MKIYQIQKLKRLLKQGQPTEKNPHSEIAQETCKIPDFPETDKKEDTGTDITLEDLSDIFLKLSQLQYRIFLKVG